MTKSSLSSKWFIWVMLPHCSPLPKEVRAGTQSTHLEAGAEARAMEKPWRNPDYCFAPPSVLTFFLICSGTTCLGKAPSHKGVDISTTIIRKKMPHRTA